MVRQNTSPSGHILAMADTADHLSPEPVLTDTIATPLEGDDLQAVQATMSMVTGEVSDGSTDTESSLQASAPATSLPAIPENPDDLLSTPQATAQLQNIITFSNGPSSPVQDDQNFDTPRPSDPEPAPEAAEDQLRETSRQKLFQPSALDVFSASGNIEKHSHANDCFRRQNSSFSQLFTCEIVNENLSLIETFHFFDYRFIP